MEVLFVVISMIPVLLAVLVAYWFTKRHPIDGIPVNPLNYLHFSPFLLPVILGVVLALNLFMYDTIVGIGQGISLSVLVVSAFLLLGRSKWHLTSFLITIIGVLAGLGVGFRGSGATQGFDIILALFCFSILAFWNALDRIFADGLWLAKQGVNFIGQTLANIPTLITLRPQNGKTPITSLIKIVIITVVLLFIFAELLSSADLVFAQLISEIKDQAIGRIIFSLFIIVFFTLVFTLKLTGEITDKFKLTFTSFLELVIPLLAVSLLFGLFLFVQGQYLFNGSAYLEHYNLTYSDYVRGGFIELIVTGLIGGILVYITTLKQQLLEDPGQQIVFKVLGIVISFELIAMLLSSLNRDIIYIDAYGLSRTRLIGLAFLAWVGSLLLLLFLLNSLSKRIQEKHLLAGMGIVTLCVFIFVNGFNLDHIIAVNRPTSDFDNARDYFYINSLSPDAIDGWENSIAYAKPELARLLKLESPNDSELQQIANIKLALISLAEKRDDLTIKYGDYETALKLEYTRIHLEEPSENEQIPTYVKDSVDMLRKWQSFNFSEYHAYQAMKEKASLYQDDLNCLISDIFTYGEKFPFQTFYNYEMDEIQVERPFTLPSLRYQPDLMQSPESIERYINYSCPTE